MGRILKSALAHKIRSWVFSRKFAGAISVVIIAGLISFFDILDIADTWMVAGTVVLTLFGWLIGNALDRDTADREVIRSLSVAIVCLGVALLGTVAYYEWWERMRDSAQGVEFVVATDDETAVVRLSGEPGGKPLKLSKGPRPLQPLAGGHSYVFTCRVVMDDGSRWLRLGDTTYWAPEDLLRPRAGASAQDLPSC